MSRGNDPTTLQQRMEIWERSQGGETDAAIARAMQLDRETVRKWRRRAQHQGRPGLESCMGRPRCGPLGQSSPQVSEAVRRLRAEHPGWGPQTLRLELRKEPALHEQSIPCRSQVAAFLHAEGLTRRYEHHSDLVQPPVEVVEVPHEEWEMDAQGVRRVTGVGRVTLINIGDPYSHVRVESLACLAKSKAETADYQLALRRAFLGYGRPERLSLDHDSVFYDNTSASPFPTRLHLWLIALGIEVRFIPEGRPTAHGFIERTHQIVDQQAMYGQDFERTAALQPWLEERLDFLNQSYPSRALGGEAPLTAYPTATHSGRDYRPEAEAEALNLQRVYLYLARHTWYRRVTAPGQFTLGTYRYGLGKVWGNQDVQIRFDAQTQELVCTSEDGQRTHRLKAQGLTKQDLMGELQMDQFPVYQFAFPWLPEQCRLNVLYGG